MSLQTVSHKAARSRTRSESPLGLLIASIQERIGLSERDHRAAFRRLILSPGYEDFIDAVVEEWMSIKYSTALRAAQPLSIQEVRANVSRRLQQREEKAAQVVAAKEIMGLRLLDLVMPNGKALRDCTGGDCIRFGGFYTRIGKKVGKARVVGKVLTAADLIGLLKNR